MQNDINIAVTESHQTLEKHTCMLHILFFLLFAFIFIPEK